MAKQAVDWADFLGRPPVVVDAALAASAVQGGSVLITGAGGSIGSGLARAALAGRPQKLVVMDLSESALYESCRRLSLPAEKFQTEVVPVIGSVGDARCLSRIFQQHRPEIVFHAAAYKHVPLMEQNPFSAFANNAVGTYRLAVAAREGGAGRLILISTDKAVNPQSMMGASKRIAELVVLSHSTSETRMNAVRLGNVLGSSGSVVAIFQEEVEDRRPLTVTHPEAERYFLSPPEAEAAILAASASRSSGRIFVPDCGRPFPIVKLARYLAGREEAGKGLGVEFVGLRAGDKLREELLAPDEVVESQSESGMRAVRSPFPSASEAAGMMQRLESSIESGDLLELRTFIEEFVPGYRPSGATLSAVVTASR